VAEIKYETDAERTGLESVLRARNELASLGLMLAELERSRSEALAELAQTIHLPRGAAMDLRPMFTKTEFSASVDDLVALIEPRHPELAARRSEVNRDITAEALARRDYFPDLTTGFEWQAMGPTGVSPVATGADSYYLSLGVNLPIYRHRLSAAVRESRYNVARSSERYASAWDELRATVQKLHAQIVEHDRAIELLEQQLVPQSEKTFTLSIEAYRVGRISFEQLIASYRELLQYRIELYARKSRREQAIAALELTVGGAIAEATADFETSPARRR
jgi:outer membrane protein TolC